MITAEFIGGFIRWLLRRCKTNLHHEMHSRTEPMFMKSTSLESLLLGYSVVIFIIILIAKFW